MPDAVGATIVLCAVTGGAAGLAAWNAIERRGAPGPSAAGRDGAAIFWLGYALLFLGSSFILLGSQALPGETLAQLLVDVGAVAFCISAAGASAQVLYLLRGRSAWPLLAAVWGCVLVLLLVGGNLYPADGAIAADASPLLVRSESPPSWIVPAAALALALPAASASYLFLRAAQDLPGRERLRARILAVAIGCAALWTWWTLMVAGTPALNQHAIAVAAARSLGVLPPFLVWSSQLFLDGGPPELSGRPLAATNR